MKRKIILILMLAAAGPPARAVQYQMTLPLQYNYYQPLDAAGLGAGQVTCLTSGPLALFGNPCRLEGPGTRLSAEAGGAFLSPSHSHVLITTSQSLALPAAAAAVWSFGKFGLALGYAGQMNTEMSFPDQWQPSVNYRAGLHLRKLSLGGFYAVSPGIRAGLALEGSSAGMTWQKGDTMVAQGSAWGQNMNAGIELAIGPDMIFFTRLRTECRLEGTADYLPQEGGGDLNLYGVAPALSSLGFSYRIDSTASLAGQIDITGWQNASWDYRGRADYRLGVELRPGDPGYVLRLGFFTMGTPLVPLLIQNYPALRDMYFISAGQSFTAGPVTVNFSGATSRLFSGSGLKQDMLALSLQYRR